MLTLVKKLSYLQEEQKHSQVYLETGPFKLLRGSLTELVGKASTGKSSLALMLLAGLTQKGEICAVVDVSNSFDPLSAAASDVVLENLLWIKCGGNVEHAFKAIDYLIQAKNFGSIWLDLSGSTSGELSFIPSSYWYRFRTRIKDSGTLLISTSEHPLMGPASSQSYQLEKSRVVWSGSGRFKLIEELQITLDTQKPFFLKPENLRIEAKY
jgi:recA bacterial DNA recombination protein